MNLLSEKFAKMVNNIKIAFNTNIKKKIDYKNFIRNLQT